MSRLRRAIFVTIFALIAVFGSGFTTVVAQAQVEDSCANPGPDTGNFEQSGDFSGQNCQNAPVTVPLTFISACTPFDDFAYYTYTFGPGATSGLTSLSYTYTAAGLPPYQGTYQGTIMFAAKSATIGPSPLSHVRSLRLTESTGTYRFEMRLLDNLTPGTLTVSDAIHTASAPTPVRSTVTVYCAEHFQ